MIELDFNHRVRDIILHLPYFRNNVLYTNNQLNLVYASPEQVEKVIIPEVTADQISQSELYNSQMLAKTTAETLHNSLTSSFETFLTSVKADFLSIIEKYQFIRNRMDLYELPIDLGYFNFVAKLDQIRDIFSETDEQLKLSYYNTKKTEIDNLIAELITTENNFYESIIALDAKSNVNEVFEKMISLNSQVLVFGYIMKSRGYTSQRIIKLKCELISQHLKLVLNSVRQEITDDIKNDIVFILDELLILNREKNTVKSKLIIEQYLDDLFSKLKSISLNKLML